MRVARKTKVAIPELRGKGICLKPARPADAPCLERYIRNKAIARYTLMPSPYPRGGVRRFIRSVSAEAKAGQRWLFVIRRYDSNEPIGTVDLMNYNPVCRRAELGFWLARKYWNKGIMTQAVKLALKFAFDVLKLHRVAVRHFDGNDASRRVIEKCWFRREGVSREAACRDRKWFNLIDYGLLESEFRQMTGREVHQ